MWKSSKSGSTSNNYFSNRNNSINKNNNNNNNKNSDNNYDNSNNSGSSQTQQLHCPTMEMSLVQNSFILMHYHLLKSKITIKITD